MCKNRTIDAKKLVEAEKRTIKIYSQPSADNANSSLSINCGISIIRQIANKIFIGDSQDESLQRFRFCFLKEVENIWERWKSEGDVFFIGYRIAVEE